MPEELSCAQIIDLLTELGSRLAGRGEHGHLYVVGGAAMALLFDRRRITQDIDAVFSPSPAVRQEAEEMARKHHLRADWLSSAAAAFTPGGDSETTFLHLPGLDVEIASPQHLVAMKLAAGRRRDRADLAVLFAHLGITTPEQAVDVAFAAYGEHSVVLGESREDIRLLAQAVLQSALP